VRALAATIALYPDVVWLATLLPGLCDPPACIGGT
jgi:hypothetical protein